MLNLSFALFDTISISLKWCSRDVRMRLMLFLSSRFLLFFFFSHFPACVCCKIHFSLCGWTWKESCVYDGAQKFYRFVWMPHKNNKGGKQQTRSITRREDWMNWKSLIGLIEGFHLKLWWVMKNLLKWKLRGLDLKLLLASLIQTTQTWCKNILCRGNCLAFNFLKTGFFISNVQWTSEWKTWNVSNSLQPKMMKFSKGELFIDSSQSFLILALLMMLLLHL